MFQTPSPLSRIKNLVPVSAEWLVSWEQAWRQRQKELEEARRQDLQRAQELRKVVLF